MEVDSCWQPALFTSWQNHRAPKSKRLGGLTSLKSPLDYEIECHSQSGYLLHTIYPNRVSLRHRSAHAWVVDVSRLFETRPEKGDARRSSFFAADSAFEDAPGSSGTADECMLFAAIAVVNEPSRAWKRGQNLDVIWADFTGFLRELRALAGRMPISSLGYARRITSVELEAFVRRAWVDLTTWKVGPQCRPRSGRVAFMLELIRRFEAVKRGNGLLALCLVGPFVSVGHPCIACSSCCS